MIKPIQKLKMYVLLCLVGAIRDKLLCICTPKKHLKKLEKHPKNLLIFDVSNVERYDIIFWVKRNRTNLERNAS